MRFPSMIDIPLQRFALFALLAAALFGASAPLSKLLLGGFGPFSLAAYLYLGSGLGLLAVWLLRRIGARSVEKEAPLAGRDFLWLAGAIASGGIAAPVLLLWGLAGIPASGASLLLSTEGVLTTLISALVFKEAVAGRVWLAALFMLLAGGLLAYAPGGGLGLSVHALAVVAACGLWGLDNNLTRPISGGDPVMIAMIKGLAAGGVNIVLARLAGEAVPTPGYAAAAMTLGSLAYGVSLLFYILALRHLGSARTAAHFGTAPFIGAVLSVLLLGEPLSGSIVAAFGLMLVASWLVLTERHGHQHRHEPLQHSHRHIHDEHHRHAHGDGDGPEPHSHPHSHEPLVHSHPHLPDLHHRHGH